MSDTNAVWVVAAGALLLTAGLVAHFYAVPSMVRGMVEEKVALEEGSEALERFRKTPQPLHLNVYLFHVRNPEAVSGQGARPELVEKGPYVYDLHRERVDLEFHDHDDSVSYFPKNTYHFNQAKSGCRSESDVVTVIHVPILVGRPLGLQGTALKLQQVSAMGLGIFNDAVPLLFKASNIFLTTTVGELLFGGVFVNCSFPEDSFPAGAVCQGLRLRAPSSYRRQGTDFYFSMFGNLNGTSRERLRVRRGRADASAVGRLVAVDGNATLSKWRQGAPATAATATCNMINGTDGSIFPPFRRGTTAMPIFTSSSCRSLLLHYTGDTDLNGVAVMRFVIGDDMLASGRHYQPNRCFCAIPPEEQQPDVDEEEDEGARRRRRRQAASFEEKELQACLPNGTMSLTPCSGSPVVLSLPHFYLGDEVLLEYPVGLSPSEAAHQTIVDIEPVTGIPVRAKKRVQLNIFLKKIEEFNYLTSVSEGLFPILWMEEGITLEGASFDKIASAGRGLAVLSSLPWAVLALGAALALGGLAFLAGLPQKLLPRPRPPRVQQGKTAAPHDPRPLDALGSVHSRLSVSFVSGDEAALAFAQKAPSFTNNKNYYNSKSNDPDNRGAYRDF